MSHTLVKFQADRGVARLIEGWVNSASGITIPERTYPVNRNSEATSQTHVSRMFVRFEVFVLH